MRFRLRKEFKVLIIIIVELLAVWTGVIGVYMFTGMRKESYDHEIVVEPYIPPTHELDLGLFLMLIALSIIVTLGNLLNYTSLGDV